MTETQTPWWEVDTSAIVRVVCKECGDVHEVTTNLDATKGEKVVTLDGYCEAHSFAPDDEDA